MIKQLGALLLWGETVGLLAQLKDPHSQGQELAPNSRALDELLDLGMVALLLEASPTGCRRFALTGAGIVAMGALGQTLHLGARAIRSAARLFRDAGAPPIPRPRRRV